MAEYEKRYERFFYKTALLFLGEAKEITTSGIAPLLTVI